MSRNAERAFDQARHDTEQARLGSARALNLSPRRIVHRDGVVYPGNAVYRQLDRLPPGLGALESTARLDLAGSRVAVLDGVLEMPALDELHFRGIPACGADPELARIADIEDPFDRTAKALAHLRQRETAAEPAFPAPAPAPLMVGFEEDRLVPLAAQGAAKDDAAARRARDAWTALRAYHDEIAGVLTGRNMAHLDRALAAFDRALGPVPDAMNVFGLGTHGRRIARIAAEADAVLLDDAAADLREFAAAIALYLDRFTDWRDYLSDAEATSADASALRPDAETLARAFAAEPWSDPAIADGLAAASDAAEPDEPVGGRGLVASLCNLVGAIGQRALAGLRTARRETGRLLRETVVEFRKSIAKRTAQALTVALLGFLASQAMRLEALARALPAQLGWISDFLRQLGLL